MYFNQNVFLLRSVINFSQSIAYPFAFFMVTLDEKMFSPLTECCLSIFSFIVCDPLSYSKVNFLPKMCKGIRLYCLNSFVILIRPFKSVQLEAVFILFSIWLFNIPVWCSENLILNAPLSHMN